MARSVYSLFISINCKLNYGYTIYEYADTYNFYMDINYKIVMLAKKLSCIISNAWWLSVYAQKSRDRREQVVASKAKIMLPIVAITKSYCLAIKCCAKSSPP